jgi:hypothetical protein
MTWRGRGFYASGGAEQQLLSGADLAALQSQVSSSEFTEKLTE